MFQAAQLCFTNLISINNICKRRLFRLSQKRKQAKTTLLRISPASPKIPAANAGEASAPYTKLSKHFEL